MGLMDKFKNLFTDEEILEEETIEPVEIKEVKKEEINQLPTFMREKLKEETKEEEVKFHNFNLDLEEKKNLEVEEKNSGPEPSNIIREKNNFKFPMDLNDDDFIETRQRSKQQKSLDDSFVKRPEQKEKQAVESPKKEVKVADLYKDKKEVKKETKSKFKATPIISPIYGVLDKNYSPVDVECNVGENFETKRPSKNVDFDSVRKKAYGTLSEEIKENLMCENCEYLKEAKECRKPNSNIEENLVYEAMNKPNNDCYYSDITLDEATENYYDYGVEYEKATSYSEKYPNQEYEYQEENYIRLDKQETNDYTINTPEEKTIKSIPPVKSSINLLSTLKKSMGDENKEKKNLELTDDLFNLIDSMYDERNDS